MYLPKYSILPVNIYGNNFLVSIAYKAPSPNQAAKIADLMGCSKAEIKAVRNAAVLKRDFGEGEFRKKFEPFTLVDTNIQDYKSMRIRVKLKRLYDERPLNAVEYNQVADLIRSLLNNHGIEVQIDKKRAHPYVKSTLKISK